MDKNKAYITNNLLLPKSKINAPQLIKSLSFEVGNDFIFLAKDFGTHIQVPKFFKTKEQLEDLDFETIDISNKEFPKINFKSNIKWRSEKQKIAHEAFSSKHSGVLNLNPGRGKTVHALKRIEEIGTPALIVVHNSHLAAQWVKRIEDPAINLIWPGQDIGLIGNNKFDWKHPVTIAMIQSIVNKVKKNNLPEEFSNWFGQIYFDEGHHLAAKKFNLAGDICWGNRYLLTATLERIDGLDCIPTYHCGPIIYSDLTWDIVPEILFIKTEANFKLSKWDNFPLAINKLITNQEANKMRLNYIKADYNSGRRVMVLSERLEQLYEYAKYFENSCVIDGSVNPFERETIMRSHKISFIISDFGQEGLDIDDYDTIHMITPIGGDKTYGNYGSSKLLGNRIMQIIGRCMREKEGKKHPKVVIYNDYNIDMFNNLNNQLKQFFRLRKMSFTEE